MPVLEIEATITRRGQTTVPAAIRKALQVNQGTIVYRIEETGQVTISGKAPVAEDPVVGKFLAFLEADMLAHPEALRPASVAWANDLRALTAGVEIDLDAPLADDAE